MKINRIIALALAFVLLSVVGCSKNGDTTPSGGDNNADQSNIPNKENGGIMNSNISLGEGEVVFRGKVSSNSERHYIEMEIVDSEIAFGTYHVLIGDVTEFYGADGEKIDRETIKSGDIIEVVFAGQVMQSFPPKISAKRVYLVK